MNGATNGHALVHHHHHAKASLPQQQHGSAGASKQRPGLPPTPPGSHAAAHADVCMDDAVSAARAQSQGGSGLPPRKAHRRSRSDVSFGYLPPPSPKSGWALPGGDDLFNAYMSMECMANAGGLKYSSDGDRSGMRTTGGADSSENESEDYGAGADSQFLVWGGVVAGKKREGVWRNAAGDRSGQHARSLSMDSLMGTLTFSANGEPGKFSLGFGGGEFTPAEMKRIMADEKLADPRRVKRYVH
jgi:hypothetical protein